MAKLYQIFVHVSYFRGSVLWWHCDILCTSGFVDDVMFHIVVLWNMISISVEISPKFCSMVMTESTRHELGTSGKVCRL